MLYLFYYTQGKEKCGNVGPRKNSKMAEIFLDDFTSCHEKVYFFHIWLVLILEMQK